MMVNINDLSREELIELRKKVLLKIGKIQVELNKVKQKKYKFDELAQANIIYYNDTKKHLIKRKDLINKKLKEKEGS